MELNSEFQHQVLMKSLAAFAAFKLKWTCGIRFMQRDVSVTFFSFAFEINVDLF